jgi:hypothetical protein
MTPLDDLIRRAWPIFREAARQARTLTYTELAGRVGPPLTRRQVHRQLLTPLSTLCRRCGLPDPAALVVRKDSGRPGGGFHAAYAATDPEACWSDQVAACWRWPWPPAPPDELLRLARTPAGTREQDGMRTRKGMSKSTKTAARRAAPREAGARRRT